jgi:hypothetical protein
MSNQIKVSRHEVRELVREQSIEVGPGVLVRRVTRVRLDRDERVRTVQESVEGPPIAGEHPGNFCVVEPELLEHLRVSGWFTDDKDYGLISKKPFSRVKRGGPYEVVRLRSYDHTVFDASSGLPLPVGIWFDYMDGSGSVNNETFRLGPLFTALEARQDVTIGTERYGDSKVQSVPGYNRGGGSGTRFIQFCWGPQVELYREYLRLVSEAGPSVWDAKHTVALTLMGLDQFRLPKRERGDSSSEDDE